MKRSFPLAAVLAVALALPASALAYISPTWNLNGTYTIDLTCTSGCGGDWIHSMTITTTSDTTGAVSGTGYYSGGSPTWVVTGQVTGWDVVLDVDYDGSTYALHMIGKINQWGGMAGTATGPGQTFTWQTTAGSVSLSSPRCDYGTYPKSVMVWSGFAPATGAVITTPALEATRDYFVEASGTYFAGGDGPFDIEADAEYSQDAIQRAAATPWTDLVNNYGGSGEELLELYIDGAAVEWGAFSANHRYALDVVPTGSPLDINANIYDIYTPNNTGGLCVALYYEDATGPITSAVVVAPPTVGSGGSVTVTANVDDTTTGGSLIKSAAFSLDGGPWTPMAAADGAFDEMVENVTASFTGPLDGGSYSVCVRGTDVMDNTGGAACTSLTVYDAYAKISGTAGGPSGNGKSLAFSFEGWVATAGGEILGKIDVNYRILGTTCRYTPDGDSGLTILSGIATLTNWHSSCEPAGQYDLQLWDRDLYPVRGEVRVDGPGSMYDISRQLLATGNVHVVDLTPGTTRGLFSAPDSLYYNGLTPAAGLYGNGPIEFYWENNAVYGGFWNEIAPPTTGTTYYNIVDGTAVIGGAVTLHFSRTNPNIYAFSFTGTLSGTRLSGNMDGPYLFIADGTLIVS